MKKKQPKPTVCIECGVNPPATPSRFCCDPCLDLVLLAMFADHEAQERNNPCPE